MATYHPTSYDCHHCGGLNNPLDNDWCSCVTAERSLICSVCGECFCKAPASWRRRFWATTSQELRQRSRERKTTVRPALAALPKQLARPIVLIVDDDQVVHLVTSRILSSFEGTVLHSQDGGEALKLAQEVLPDLVVTDALLPTLDGRELAKALKQSPATEGCKVAVMTGLYKGHRYRQEAFRDFLVDDYLEKPVDASKLKALVDTVQVPYAARTAAIG